MLERALQLLFLGLLLTRMVSSLEGSVVILGKGDVFSFSFSNMSFSSGPSYPGDYESVLLTFENDGFDFGESFQIDMFRTSSFESPFVSRTLTNNQPGSYPIPAAFSTDRTAWADLQGSGRITVLEGAIGLAQIDVTRSFSYGVSYATSIAVPEPSTFLPVVAGGLFVYGCGRRRFRRGLS